MTTKSRLEGLPRYSAETTQVDAPLYNEVRLALLRLESPIRFRLPSLRHLEMIIDEDSWICVDVSLYEIPVLAWTDFKAVGRSNLHEPVGCSFYTYHAHAEKIVDEIKESIRVTISERLHSH